MTLLLEPAPRTNDRQGQIVTSSPGARCRTEITDTASGQASTTHCAVAGCRKPPASHPELHRHQDQTTRPPRDPCPARSCLPGLCHPAPSDGARVWPSLQASASDSKDAQGGATPDTLNSTAQTTKTPVQAMGSLRLMEATPFHFECLCIRVTLISKFT